MNGVDWWLLWLWYGGAVKRAILEIPSRPTSWWIRQNWTNLLCRVASNALSLSLVKTWKSYRLLRKTSNRVWFMQSTQSTPLTISFIWIVKVGSVNRGQWWWLLVGKESNISRVFETLGYSLIQRQVYQWLY